MMLGMNNFIPLVDVTDVISDINLCNSDTGSRYYAICLRYSSLCRYIFKITITVLTLICLFMMMAPIIQYIFIGEMSPTAGMYFPGVTDYDIKTYTLLLLCNYAILFVAYCVELSILGLIYLVFASIYMLSQMLVSETIRLQEISSTVSFSIHKQLTNVIFMHFEYKRFDFLFISSFHFPQNKLCKL